MKILILFTFIMVCAHAKLFVTLAFDDALSEHAEVARLLQTYSMRGIFYLNSGRIGYSKRYLTIDQVKNLRASGHSIGGRTINNVNMSAVSDQERVTEVCGDFDNFVGWGLPVTDFAFPFSSKRYANSSDIPRSCGFQTTRGSGGLGCVSCKAAIANHITKCQKCPPAMQLPLTTFYPLRSVSFRSYMADYFIQMMDKANTLNASSSNTSSPPSSNNLTNVVDQKQFYWTILVFHSVGNFNLYNSITFTQLTAILEWILLQQNIAVITPFDISNIASTSFEQLHSQNLITNSSRKTLMPTSVPSQTSSGSSVWDRIVLDYVWSILCLMVVYNILTI